MRPRDIESTVADRDLLAMAERIIARSHIDAETGCYRYGGHNRYGHVTRVIDGQRLTFATHRIAYTYLAGPIPVGHELDHVAKRGCRFHDCWNIAHLEPVLHAENIHRSAPATKSACKNGHPFDEANTYFRKGGQRECRICNADRQRQFQERKRSTLDGSG